MSANGVTLTSTTVQYQKLTNSADALKQARTRTDVPCLGAFIGFWALWLICTLCGVCFGEPGRLYHGFDFHGRLCGIDVPGKGLLYWPNPNSLQYPICLSACPVDNSQQILTPVDDVHKEGAGNNVIIRISSSERWVSSYSTKPLAGRYCIPTDWRLQEKSKRMVKEESKYTNSAFLSHIADLKSAGGLLTLTLPLAIAAGYGYLFALKKVAKIILWAFFGVVILLVFLCSIFCFSSAGSQGNNLFSEYAGGDAQTTSILWGLLGFLLIAVIVLMMLALRKTIDAASRCAEYASSILWTMPTMIMFPLAEAVVKFVFFMIWLCGFAFVASMGTITQKHTDINGVTIHGILRTFEFSPLEQSAILVYLWAFLWGMEFLSAGFQFAVAHSSVKWYFKEHRSGKKTPIGESEVHSGFMVAVQNHLGSLALGAVIVGPFTLVNKLLGFVVKQSKSGNRATEALTKACSCCIMSFDRVFQYLSKLAYVELAVQSDNLWPAAKRAVKVVSDSSMPDSRPQATALIGICGIFRLLGTLGISSFVMFLVLWFTTSLSTYTSDASPYFIANPTLVALVSGIIAFVVAIAFMSTFDMISDSILYCNLRDHREKGDGDSVYEPKTLQNIVMQHGSEMQRREFR